MKFKMKGTIIFEADNINDAFAVIGNYYLLLSKEGEAENDFLPGTKLYIRPIK